MHDRDQAIRGAIRATMTHPLAGMEIKLRFERQLRQASDSRFASLKA